MKQIITGLFIAFLCLANHCYAQIIQDRSSTFITNIAKGKADEAYAMADAVLQSKIKPAQLSVIWQQMEAKFGKWNSVQVSNTSIQDSNQVVITENDFERAMVGLRVVLNSANKVASFTIVQVTEKADTGMTIPVNIKEEDLAIHTSEGDLQGTLALPDGFKGGPVALIIGGSGPTDRNGNSYLGITSQSYRLLAYGLASKGIASLRYDKRMIGASKNFTKQPEDVTLDDFVDDAVACVQQLKTDKRFDRVYIIGHSEGSLIGMLVAGKEKVNGFVSLSGAGQPIDEILKSQIKTMNPDQYADAAKILDAMKTGTALPVVPESLKMLFNKSTINFLKSQVRYDPAKMIATLKTQVLIVGGTRDLQIGESERNLLVKARPDAKVGVIEGMNHVLKQSPPDIPGNLKTYSDAKLPIDSQLVRVVAAFIYPR